MSIVRLGEPAGTGPVSSYEQPFDLLEACHERVARSLDLLARLREHLHRLHQRDEPAARPDGPARSAATDVLRYFDLAAPQHHADEERHVFPLLETAPAPPELIAAVQRLRQDHDAFARHWQVLRPLLAEVAAGAWPTGGLDALDAAADRFACGYAAHLACEHEQVFPAARRLLDAGAVRAMGDEMARRRGAMRPAPAG